MTCNVCGEALHMGCCNPNRPADALRSRGEAQSSGGYEEMTVFALTDAHVAQLERLIRAEGYNILAAPDTGEIKLEKALSPYDDPYDTHAEYVSQDGQGKVINISRAPMPHWKQIEFVVDENGVGNLVARDVYADGVSVTFGDKDAPLSLDIGWKEAIGNVWIGDGPAALTDANVAALEHAIRAEGYDIEADPDTGEVLLKQTRSVFDRLNDLAKADMQEPPSLVTIPESMANDIAAECRQWDMATNPLSALEKILAGARSQGAHTGMSWTEVESICLAALGERE